MSGVTRPAITAAHTAAFATAAIASYREGTLPLQALKDLVHELEAVVLQARATECYRPAPHRLPKE